jgi:hypothetical protein
MDRAEASTIEALAAIGKLAEQAEIARFNIAPRPWGARLLKIVPPAILI